MSMFTRSDRVSDPTPGARPQPRDASDVPTAPVAHAPEPRRAASASGGTQTSGVSVISKALKITGQLESTEDIQIEGEVDGDVRAASVKVGNNARVKGTVYGDEVELAGTVDGKIEARRVFLTSTAHMSGDVIHQDIRIESGAYMNGHCRPEFGKSDTKAAAKPAAAPVAAPVAAPKSNGAA
jgi:cytoskeletal protein CcmA (bactofilin family)